MPLACRRGHSHERRVSKMVVVDVPRLVFTDAILRMTRCCWTRRADSGRYLSGEPVLCLGIQRGADRVAPL